MLKESCEVAATAASPPAAPPTYQQVKIVQLPGSNKPVVSTGKRRIVSRVGKVGGNAAQPVRIVLNKENFNKLLLSGKNTVTTVIRNGNYEYDRTLK
ncbi:unnamed protein product [Leptidea sinapis]|uniref:Uncharacterized protein n=1 Tax=Leptidea sinapis TaxID=189913 RepID=A0A5E4PYA0_9NEOP|nr:unnamed protein product [Leptidea sinapis]